MRQEKLLQSAIMFLLATVFIQNVYAEKEKRRLEGEEVFNLHKNAIVRINTLQQGVAVSHGTGFFVSPAGLLVTNRHVVDNVLTGIGFTLEFETINGKKTKDYTISECSYDRNLDLCILKLPVKPTSWIPAKKMTFSPGQKVYVIGHPSGFDFSITDGLLSGVRKLSMTGRNVAAPLTVEQIQVSAPISPGNSGGPILNDRGELLGVSTWIRTGKNEQNLNFGLSVNEIIPNLVKSKFETIQKKRALFAAKDKALVAVFKEKVADPAFKELGRVEKEKGKSRLALNPAQFTPFVFEGFSRKYAVDLPQPFQMGCQQTEKTSEFVMYRCTDLAIQEGFLQIKIQRRFLNLKALNGKFLPARPLQFVEDLKKAGRWEEIAKTLTPGQIKFLNSVQSKPITCKSNDSNPTYALLDFTTSCNAMTYNDIMPGWSSVTNLYDVPGMDIGVEIVAVASNPNLSYIYYSVGNIAALSFRRLF